MTRRTVRVELDRRSAVLTGPRVDVALQLTRARWHWHETRGHRAVRVHRDDLDDVLAALDLDGQHVDVVGEDGRPIAAGGLIPTGSG